MRPAPALRGGWILAPSLLMLAWGLSAGAAKVDGQGVPRLKGTLAMGQYISARDVFQVRVPQSTNWAGVPFSMSDLSNNDALPLDLVTFLVDDFGETLILGVRHLPDEAIKTIAVADPKELLKNIGALEVGAWKSPAKRPERLQSRYVATHLGPGLVDLYKVEKGSILRSVTMKPDRTMEATPIDALVAVMVVRRPDHYIFALAENDGALLPPFGKGIDDPQAGEALRGTIRGFFAGVKLLPHPRFHGSPGDASGTTKVGGGAAKATPPPTRPRVNTSPVPPPIRRD